MWLPAEWKRLEAEVVMFLKDFQGVRLLRAYHALVEPRIKALPAIVHTLARRTPAEVFPAPWQFALMPEVREIVDHLESTPITLASFDPVEEQIPQMASAWRDTVRRGLIDRINSAVNTNILDDADLASLALGTFYSCRCMYTGFKTVFRTLPQFLVDSCYPERTTLMTNERLKPLSEADRYFRMVESALYKVGGHTAEGWVFQIVHHIIETCGLDPATTTVEDMDTVNLRLVCVTANCKSYEHTNGILAVYDWRSAVSPQ